MSAMTLPDGIDLPVLLIGGGLLLIALLWLFAGLRKGSGRDTAQMIAAVQAERDVLRANHAVDIATLETKLAEAQERLQSEMDATLKLKAAEQKLQADEGRVAALEKDLQTERARTARIAQDLDEQKARIQGVPKLQSERDRAVQELETKSQELSDLRRELSETMTKLSKATAERQNRQGDVEALTKARDEALEDLARQVNVADALRREMAQMAEKVGNVTEIEKGRDTLARELEALREREALLSRTVRERDGQIQELRNALAARTDDDATEPLEAEIARLKDALDAAEGRERTANESLSRLAYDRDGMKTRVEAAERTEREARAEVEKRDALLELRLQKIEELQTSLRNQQGKIADSLRRAEIAEDAIVGEDGDVSLALEAAREAERAMAAERDAALAERDEAIKAQEAALASAPAADDGAAKEKIAALEEALAAARAGHGMTVDPQEVAALKATIRDLAERFMDAPDVVRVAEPRELSLADKIRAFKAARDTESRPALRIAAPRD
ncbi:MAG: hypothetical protein AAF318_09740 [Pseudomonadota bacterium]